MAAASRGGTVGQAIPGVEVKIAEDGEILVRGENVFLGYYKDPEATAATLVDGWLHSGDLGAFDADGFPEIVGARRSGGTLAFNHDGTLLWESPYPGSEILAGGNPPHHIRRPVTKSEIGDFDDGAIVRPECVTRIKLGKAA